MYKLRRRRLALALVSLAFTAACSDQAPVTAPSASPPLAGERRLAALDCLVEVRTGAMSCAPAAAAAAAAAPSPNERAPRHGGPRLDLTIGGQNVYVRIATAGPQTRTDHADGTLTWAGPVTVTNLMAQPLGTADGVSTSGVRVFFHQQPTVTAGSGAVEVEAPDGLGTFTGSGQPYYLYPQLIQPGATSGPRSWAFRMSPTVAEFRFVVYVRAALPDEQGALRWTPESSAPNALRDVRRVFGAYYAVGDNGEVRTRPAAAGGAWTRSRCIYGGWTSSTAPHPLGRVGAGGGSTVLYVGDAGVTTSGCISEVVQSPTWGVVYRGVWGNETNLTYLVGDRGLITRFFDPSGAFPTTGTDESTRLTDGHLHDVIGFGLEDAFAVGARGYVFRRTAVGRWELLRNVTGATLRRVWGSSVNDVFVVGDFGTILHVNGTTATRMTSGTTNTLRAVWGTGPSDVYAAGDFGTLLHYDGVRWSPVSAGTSGDLFGVWGTGPTEIYAVGADAGGGVILRGQR